MGIYTKKGDQGRTSNLLGESLFKDSPIIDLQGHIDEINAGVGYLRGLVKQHQEHTAIEIKEQIDSLLKDIQYALFRVGGDIASKFNENYILEEDIKDLERGIDDMTLKMGALNHFIYYNGTISATYCQVLRSVIRRGERVFVKGLELMEWEGSYPLDYQYINRLSDYCFTLGRYLNYIDGQEEEKMYLH